MFMGRQRGLADLLQQLRHAGVLRQINAQGQGVDEETDQVLGFGAATVGARHAYHYIAFVAQTCHKHRPGTEQAHEQGDVMGLAEALQTLIKRRIDRHGHRAAAVALQRRTRPVGGQRQQRRRATQVLTPEVGLLGKALAGKGAALPGGVVGVLN